jgi:hypothetical protein
MKSQSRKPQRKVCAGCGEVFEATDSRKRFCELRCRNERRLNRQLRAAAPVNHLFSPVY